MSVRRLWLARAAALVVGLICGLALAEAALRVVEKTRLRDRALEENLAPDPQLGRRIAPHSNGHDANGFRNDSVPSHADVVAIGDSQTWGVNVSRSDAWPQQLARTSGLTVYNMGMGGYGPVHYFSLIEKARDLSPRIIVVGIYTGNDLYDAYQLAYTNDNYQWLRDPVATLLPDSVAAKAQFYWDEEKHFHNQFGRSSPSGWSIWLREHLALGRFLNRAGLWPGATDVDYEIDKAWAERYPDHGSVFPEGNTRTVFTTAYRLVGLDLDEPRIQEGLRITSTLLPLMRRSAEQLGARLIVVIIPTKEMVYADAFKEKVFQDTTYQKLVQMETKATAEMTATCASNNIEYLNVLPALSGALKRGEQIYPSSTESHPNGRGYELLAGTVSDFVRAGPR